MPEHVLEHHDGVVHQHADAQGEAAQAHDVERHVEEVEQRKGADHRDRNRQGHRHRIARVPQEQEQHQEGQETTEHQRLHHVADCLADEPGLAHRYVEAHVGELSAQLVQHLVHTLRHPHRVGARLLEQQQPHRLLAVVAGYRLAVLEAVLHVSDVANQHDAGTCAVPRAVRAQPQWHPLDLLDRLELSERAQRVAITAAQDRAAGRALIGGIQSAEHILYRVAVALEQARIDLDVDLALEAAGDRRLRDAIDLFQPALEHRLGEVLQGSEVCAPDHRQRHDRL